MPQYDKFNVCVLNIINYVVVFCDYSTFFWCKEMIGQYVEVMIPYVSMWFLSCRVAVSRIFKYWCIVNCDFFMPI
jgi:hypothetical protein